LIIKMFECESYWLIHAERLRMLRNMNNMRLKPEVIEVSLLAPIYIWSMNNGNTLMKVICQYRD